MRPVPKTGSQIAPASPHQPQHDGWDLQWRKSPLVEETASVEEPQPIQQVSSLRPVGHDVELSRAPVATAAWANPQFDLPRNAPIPTNDPDALRPIPAPIPQPEVGSADLFSNPFGDDPDGDMQPVPRDVRPVRTSPQLDLPPPSMTAPSIAAPSSPVPPSESRPTNGLRNQLQQQAEDRQSQLEVPGNPDSATQPAPGNDGRSLRELLKGGSSTEGAGASEGESPSDRDESFDNPFSVRDPNERAADEKSRDKASTPRQPFGRMEEESDARAAGLSCEEFRKRIANQSIRDVSLDISPPFRPDIIAEDEYAKLKNKFDEKQAARQWRSIDGVPLATGRLVDLAYEKAVIRTEYGSTEQLSINRLSEADLVYISENWGLPTECLIEQVAYQPRNWTRTLMTYKASNLCHKPLYFEEVNLERYGHTAGPFLQPVVSSAHFFANIAVMPYKMGIHPPGECQYALGYYRPGNCAPWIVPPVPISLRGGLTQAAALAGAFWLIP